MVSDQMIHFGRTEAVLYAFWRNSGVPQTSQSNINPKLSSNGDTFLEFYVGLISILIVLKLGK